MFCASSLYPIISFVDCVLNIRPSIELCCLVVFDLSCNVLFRFFFFVEFVFLLLLPLMANKVKLCVYLAVLLTHYFLHQNDFINKQLLW